MFTKKTSYEENKEEEKRKTKDWKSKQQEEIKRLIPILHKMFKKSR